MEKLGRSDIILSANYGWNFLSMAASFKRRTNRFESSPMENRDVSGPAARWLQRPLCRRYLTAVFSSAPTRLTGAARSQVVHWALGQLITGEIDVLGAWNNSAGQGANSAEVARSLHARGVEFVSFLLGNVPQEHPAACFPRAKPIVSFEQVLAVAAAQVPLRRRPGLLRELRALVEADSREEALAELARFRRTGLGESYPVVIQLWDKAL
ncbi:transposase, partial [Roseateles sp. P5_E11]